MLLEAFLLRNEPVLDKVEVSALAGRKTAVRDLAVSLDLGHDTLEL